MLLNRHGKNDVNNEVHVNNENNEIHVNNEIHNISNSTSKNTNSTFQ